MADVLTPLQRSALMAHIRGRDTKPELALRSMLHRLGYRFTIWECALKSARDSDWLLTRLPILLPKASPAAGSWPACSGRRADEAGLLSGKRFSSLLAKSGAGK